MPRRKDFQAATTYNGQRINKVCEISYKIDGVRILCRDGKFVTRNNKVPPGLDIALTPDAKLKLIEYGDCEVFKGSFFETNGPLSRHDPEPNCIGVDDIYQLDHGMLDDRLYVNTISNLEKDSDYIKVALRHAVAQGYEGLVIRTATHWYRVKPSATADVYITGYFEQLDKKKVPKGQLGGFNTNYGKVTAFSDEMRKELWDNPSQYIGKMMTVTYKERYHTGKFRYCVTFNHFRTDKDEESFDTEPPLK